MDNLENIFDKLYKSSNENKANLHLLDEIIPVETQMKYFQYSKYIEHTEHSFERDFLITQLFTPDLDLEDKRYYLSLLASLVDVIAYRAIQIYNSSPLEPELASWSSMALMESKMLLDGEFLEEKQFFVSTGLGGHNGFLRFFSVITSVNLLEFNELQKDILKREFNFYFKKNNFEIEDISINKNYAKLLFLSSLNNDPKCVIENVIKECNTFGDFLDSEFILTNVKKIEDSDIEALLETKKNIDR